LEPITDPEDRNSHPEDLCRSEWSLVLIDTLGPTRKDESCRAFLLESADGDIEGKNFGKNSELPDLPSDELRVLRAEIENNDLIHVSILSEMLGPI